ncbi:hypothetical protein AS189_04210 [Arthrobacter alpinus]|uniref:Uncharacterized protein n=1 Tax=Arthrobacter alpinus TaxID=656366 RepID=A0A0S2LWN0_9MICC|nr:hypothetical protein [Arthrobacter alpinus]ALO65842.1 hypothetical protein AS189_04210 [Arthrobacter alpinus]
MYEIGELLFGRMTGPLDIAATATTILGVLLMCAALFLIGWRNDVGWGLAVAALLLAGIASVLPFPPMLLSSPAAIMLFGAGAAIATAVGVGAAVYALLLFRKLPLSAPMTRAVVLRAFRAPDVVAPVAVAVVYSLASLLTVAAIFTGLHAPLSKAPWLTFFVTGVLAGMVPAALVGLANRSRWAWFLFFVAAIAAIYGTVMSAQGSVLIFLYVVQAGLAIAGWQRWGSIPAAAVSSSPTPVKPTF